MLATLNKISRDHNCCEDAYFVKETPTAIMGGVFDGCSTGIKSHWAAQTFAYVLSEFAGSKGPEIWFVETFTMVDAWKRLRALKNSFFHNLTNFNFLATCILFVYDKDKKKLSVRVFGDGFYYVNSVEHEINQNNEPDYFGHHLNDDWEVMLQFLEKYPVAEYFDVTSFQICSDGIKGIERSQFAPPTTREPLAMLLHPPTDPLYLERQYNILKRDKFTLSDDLTIISYVQDEIRQNP